MTVLRHRVHLALLAVILLTAIGATSWRSAPADAATTAVTTSALNLRVGYYTTSRVKLVMPSGSTVEILNRSQNGYWKVVYQGIRGYAHGDYLDFGGGGGGGGATSIGTATTTSALNLRVGYQPSSQVKLVMPRGSVVDVLSQAGNGYWKVVYQGVRGYAHGDYLDFGGGGGGGGDDDGGGGGGGGGGGTGDTATTTSALNLRVGYLPTSQVKLVMPAGSVVEIINRSYNGYWKVLYQGIRGYAHGDFLDFGGGGGGGGGGSTNYILPVESGAGWKVIQGYNGGTHQGTYQNALDLAREGGGTAGSAIISPVSGTVVWVDRGSGGILIDMGNGYGAAMFHVTFYGGIGRGTYLEQGQYIGEISGPGGEGYAVTPHVEIDVWDISGGRVSVPFTGSNGLAGNELPNNGSWNQYNGRVFYP